MIRLFWLPFYRYWALRHIRKTKTVWYGDLQLRVPPGVFHPDVFFSTPIFLQFLQEQELSNCSVLDVGTGSGALALFCASRGAHASALDINPLAVETARDNAVRNRISLSVWQSDLFDNVPLQSFDCMVINPPYYPKSPKTAAEHAFFAGEQLEYFDKLFRQLPAYRHAGTRVWMILSEDCDLQKIQKLAHRYAFQLERLYQAKKWGERFEIFGLQTVEPRLDHSP